MRTTPVTKAEPWQSTEVGATETVIAEGMPGVVVTVGVIVIVPVTVGVAVTVVVTAGAAVTVPPSELPP